MDKALYDALIADRWMAHQLIFESRHPDESADGHKRLVEDIYSEHPRRLIEGFRGLGKSTYLEEAALIRAGFREFRYMVIVGASYSRACDRIASIKREIEVNLFLNEVFGRMKGSIWQEGKIVLAGGQCIQALGRDQSMLGMKYLDTRPDAALIDDVEDPEEVRTDMDREQTWGWFQKTFLPSLSHPLYSWVRVLGTRRGSGSLPERLEKSGWPATKIPIEHAGDDGTRQSSWPSKFPLQVIDQMRHQYRGDMHTYMQEYMCQPSSATDRVFLPEYIRVEPRTPDWHATYAFIDPARTTNRTSAATGWAVWSWIGPRLIVWAAGAESLQPDEIVNLAFKICDAYDPVWIGIEEDGLSEWMRQPLRTEMAKRRTMLPFKSIKAPRNKLGFIGGLQPYFAAGEVIFAQNLNALKDQLLSFPQGKIDAPNALAYALQMRPASPIYDNFGEGHVAPDIGPIADRPLYLAANAGRTMVTAALIQEIDGEVMVYADWVEEGAPEEAVARIYGEAANIGDTERMTRAAASKDFADILKNVPPAYELRRQPIRWVVPRWHRDRWQNVGLTQAIGRIPAKVMTGGPEMDGREELRNRLAQLSRGAPAVAISKHARWTLRAMAGGYSRSMQRKGTLMGEAEDGPYKMLMEGIESFVAIGAEKEIGDGAEQNFAVNKHGQRYESAMPAR